MASIFSKAKGARDFLGRFVFTSNISFQRLSNLVKTAVNYGLKRQVLDSYPPRLFIDPVNACVLHCPLCPTGKGEKGRALGSMKIADFQKILDEVGPYLYELDLYNWGEPFLNKDIWEMIAYAKKKGVKVRISSNMNCWKGGFAENIVNSGLDQLIVSCDGTDQKSYAKYRIGGDFGKVMAHVRQVATAKKRLHRKNPKLIWQFLVMRQNEHQVQTAGKVYKKYGFDALRLMPVRSDTSKEIFQSDEEKIEKSKEWLPQDEKYSRFDYRKKKKKNAPKTCIFPWTVAAINPNGSVSPCCAVYPEKHDFGNVFDKGFRAVWNNESYVAARSVVARKALESQGRKAHGRNVRGRKVVCENCLRHGFIE